MRRYKVKEYNTLCLQALYENFPPQHCSIKEAKHQTQVQKGSSKHALGVKHGHIHMTPPGHFPKGIVIYSEVPNISKVDWRMREQGDAKLTKLEISADSIKPQTTEHVVWQNMLTFSLWQLAPEWCVSFGFLPKTTLVSMCMKTPLLMNGLGLNIEPVISQNQGVTCTPNKGRKLSIYANKR